jgi:predicted transcriptional regulator
MRIDTHPEPFYPQLMTIQLTAEQEARLSAIAAQAGRPIEDLAREAVDLYLADDAHFRAAVLEGIAEAERGEFISSSEVWAAVERELEG